MIVPASGRYYRVMFPVQLEYTAPEGCPTQNEFVALVASRGGDFAHPGAGTKARGMIVRLRRAAREHEGSLQLLQDDAPTDARELRAETCSELADGLAVVAATALRGADEAVPPSVAPSAPIVAPATVRASGPVPLPAPPKAPSDTRLHSVGFWGNENVPVTTGPLRVRRELVATLSAGAVLGAIPAVVLPRYDLTLMRTNYITPPDGKSFLIGNVFGVRWSFLGKATQHSAGFSTDIEAVNAGAVACTSLTYDSVGFVAMVCASFMVGVTHLETTDSARDYQRSQSVGFGSAGVELNVRYNVTKHLHANLAAGGDLWVNKLTAESPNDSELFHSRLFNANLQLGIGVQF